MPERVETHVSPTLSAKALGSSCPPRTIIPPPSTVSVLSFNFPSRKFIILGLSVAGIAGIYVLVKKGKLTLSRPSTLRSWEFPNFDLRQYLPHLRLQPTLNASEKSKSLHFGQFKFGYQDVFDVESVITGFGSHDWEQTHAPATQTAVAIGRILQSGAVCTGKQTMDEFGLSMFGRNKRDGIAENPVVPKHFAGGAASGSGVAVASNTCDFALALDTIGGVRIPASFCGIFGYRASHEAISTVGVTPVSPSLDAVGVLSRDVHVLHQVVKLLLQQPDLEWGLPSSVLVADDCFAQSSISTVRTADLIARAVSETLGRSLVHHVNLGALIASSVPTLRNFLTEEERLLKQDTSRYTTFDGLRDAMLLILRGEFRDKHRKWFKNVDPELSSDVDVRVKFAMAPYIDGLHKMALKIKEETRAAMNELLLMDVLLVLPSTPSLPPLKEAKGKELEIFESRALSMLSLASMASCCQVTVPLGNARGIPISVSVLARHGGDMFLLESLIKLNARIQMEVDVLRQMKPSVKDNHIIARNSVLQEISPDMKARKRRRPTT